MTQKELAYVEDAIGHENNIIAVLSLQIEDLEDEEFCQYLSDEINTHQEIINDLMNLLEVEVDG